MNDEDGELRAHRTLVNDATSFTLLMSEVFCLGADAEELDAVDYLCMLPVVIDHGGDAFIAYAALKRGVAPREEFRTENYEKAYERLKELKETDKYFLMEEKRHG